MSNEKKTSENNTSVTERAILWLKDRWIVALFVILSSIVIGAADTLGAFEKFKQYFFDAPPDLIVDQYVRLGGAIEVPILVQLQSSGGPVCSEQEDNQISCSIRSNFESEDQSVPVVPYKIQAEDIATALAEYWKNQWPFKNALPLSTPLWETVATDKEIGLKLLNRVEPGLGQVVDFHLRPYLYGDNRHRSPTSLTSKVGYLFWVFENTGQTPIKNLRIKTAHVAATTQIEDYLKLWSPATKNGMITEKMIPLLRPGQQAIMLISIYERLPSGFEKKFIMDAEIPLSIGYEREEKQLQHIVRPPLREKAVTALLPFGWYQQ